VSVEPCQTPSRLAEVSPWRISVRMVCSLMGWAA
jgi:hypothetical protein